MPRFTDSAKAPRRTSKSTRESARMAEATRKSVEGLTGIGAGRYERSFTSKRIGRIVLAILIVAVFCAGLYLVAWKSELIGGRTIPDVVGWRSERAVTQIESFGFTNVVTEEVASAEVQEGMVVAVNPTAGTRVDTDTSITVEVAAAPDAETLTSEA